MSDRYPSLPAELSADALEREILAGWERDGLFERSLAARAGAPDFVFYEGPPTANGRPGIHHVYARTIKDLFCRHRAMQGFRVLRKAGWDTHGLPVEIEVEKALGISGKQDIERLGVAEFNRLCRESVFRYRSEWEQLSSRIGVLAGLRESVRHVHERVRGERVVGAQDAAREGPALPRPQDPSVLLAVRHGAVVARSRAGIRGGRGSERVRGARSGGARVQARVRRRILVWTTTPWTLVSNTALAVHPELTYVELRKKNVTEWTIVLAEARVAAVLGADWARRGGTSSGQMLGAELAGTRYRRPLDWVAYPDEGAHEIIVAEDFVSASDGSGVVHMAPAFGADDYAAGRRHGLAFMQPVNARGEFDADVPVVGGMFVEEGGRADHRGAARARRAVEGGDVPAPVPALLAVPHAAALLRARVVVRAHHGVPRRDARAQRGDRLAPAGGRRGSVRRVAREQHRLGDLARPLLGNAAAGVGQRRRPVRGRRDRQLRGARAAHRPRRCLDDFDPHKPFIDEYTWPAPSGTGTMRRVPEVIDTWFDSGSMPFAQWHYPFENREQTAAQFPADFIAEGVDQTRGWFYSLLAIATGLGDALPNNGGVPASPYRSVVVNNQVVDAAGKKMSKSRGNAVDPWAVIERHGVDAVRLFFVGVGQLANVRRFDESEIREFAGRFLLTLRNVYSFFALYANFGWEPSRDDPPVDRASAARPLGAVAPRGRRSRRRRGAHGVRRDDGGASRARVLRRRRVEVVRASHARPLLGRPVGAETRARRSRRCTKCSS